MFKWLAETFKRVECRLEPIELSRLRTMREDSVRKNGQFREKNLLTQARQPKGLHESRQSRNRALGYWFLRGVIYTTDLAWEKPGVQDECGFSQFPRF